MDSLSFHDKAVIYEKVTNYLSYEWKSKHLERRRETSTIASTNTAAAVAAQDDNPSTTGALSPLQITAIIDKNIIRSQIDLQADDNIFQFIPSVECKVPPQKNSVDCGVFVIKFVERLLDVLPATRQKDIREKLQSQFSGNSKWSTQADITKERKAYLKLLAEIQVEWKENCRSAERLDDALFVEQELN
jgi:hypothetical protein